VAKVVKANREAKCISNGLRVCTLGGGLPEHAAQPREIRDEGLVHSDEPEPPWDLSARVLAEVVKRPLPYAACLLWVGTVTSLVDKEAQIRYLRETPEHLLWLEKEVGLPKPGQNHVCFSEKFLERVA
jgi:hypothetical protein